MEGVDHGPLVIFLVWVVILVFLFATEYDERRHR